MMNKVGSEGIGKLLRGFIKGVFKELCPFTGCNAAKLIGTWQGKANFWSVNPKETD